MLKKKTNLIKKQGEDLSRYFSKEDIQTTKRHMKRRLTSLISREMQIKTAVRYHFIPIRMADIKKSTNNKWQRGCAEKGTLLHCWWERKLVQLLWRTVCRFLRKLNSELPYDPTISFLTIYLEKTDDLKGCTHTPMFMKVKVEPLCRVRLFATPWTIAQQAPPSMGFSRQEYWSGLPFPSPGDLSNPGIEPGSPALQADALPSEPPGKPSNVHSSTIYSGKDTEAT